MANKLYDSNGRLIGKIVHISVEMGAPTKVTLDTGHTLQFDVDEIACDDKYNYRIRRHGAYQNYKKGTAALHAASIKNVIFNPPATVVYWSDGTKTVVKCSVNDKFDPEKGLAMAIAKRCANNSGSYYKEIQKWVGEESLYKANFAYTPKEKADCSTSNALLKKYITKAGEDLKSAIAAATKGNTSEVLSKISALTVDLEFLKAAINK